MKTNRFVLNIKVNKVVRIFSIILLVLLFSNIVYSQNQSCKAELTVKNNINSKKASTIGTSFKLSLVSLESSTTVFNISINNYLDTSKLSHEDILFKARLFPINKKESLRQDRIKNTESNYQITLNKGENFDFIVELIPPKGVKMDEKNISKVSVTSEKCSNFSVSTLLYTKILRNENRQH